MYSYEDHLKAVKFNIKHNFSIADAIRELGYPLRNMLRQWYQKYIETDELHKLHDKNSKYSLEAKKCAVSYYMEHSHNMARTIKAIEYPHWETMREWIHELVTNEPKAYSKHSSNGKMDCSERGTGKMKHGNDFSCPMTGMRFWQRLNR